MQTVHASTSRAMTPRARGTGTSLTTGYCTVGTRVTIALMVTFMPFSSPPSGSLAELRSTSVIRAPP